MEKIATKIINKNEPLEVLINDVTIQKPKKYNVRGWEIPMFEISTEFGKFIASDIFADRFFHWNEFIGKTLTVWSQKSKSPQWLWLRIKTNPILINFDDYIENNHYYPKNKSFYVYKITFKLIDTYSYIGFTSQSPPTTRFKQHIEQIHNNDNKQNFHYYLNQSITSAVEPRFEIIGEYKNEITALLSEIINISKERKQKPFYNLNISFGGEGNEFKIHADNNNQLKIEDKLGIHFI